MLRYAITAGNAGGSDERAQEKLIADARRWAEEGVGFVQLREKLLGAGETVRLAAAMVAVLRMNGGGTKLLVNGRADVAAAAGADGVHLTSRAEELTAVQVRAVFAVAGRGEPAVSASCHTLEAIRGAIAEGVGLVLFGPVYEKRARGEVVVQGVGLKALRKACEVASGTPVLALGGVTAENAAACVEAGAAGVAGIRLFG